VTTGIDKFWQAGRNQIMKTKLGAIIFLLAIMFASAQTNNLTALLQQGLFEEQANRNLDAAIANYQSLATQFDKDRQLAATAIFRIGECYRAQGKTNEAAEQYQRILRDFSDQQTLATLSQQNLAGMGMTKTEPAAAENSDAQLLQKLEGRTFDELEKILPTLLPDATLDSLLEKRDEASVELAKLKIDMSTNNPAVWRQNAVLDEMNRQIHGKIAGMMQGLKMRAEISAPPQNAKKEDLLDLSVSPSSEEDQEIARIQTMIQNSPDLINVRSGENTPLGNAATHGWLKVATFLLDHGADVNADFNTALFSATKAGNRAMVEFLLSRGANVNADTQDTEKNTPLHIAAQKGFQAVVEVLLANKADVNAQASSGSTPLLLAAQKNNSKIISLLLEHKADVNMASQHGETPLIAAAHPGTLEIVKLLLQAGANPNAVADFNGEIMFSGGRGSRSGSSGRTALSFAVDNGSTEMVKMLLDAKADPNAGTFDAPLLCAIYKQNAASAELLLQAGANPNVPGKIQYNEKGNSAYFLNNESHLTPLWLAIYLDQPDIVQLLLKFKADPNDSQTDGRSLLFSAMSDTNILEALLDAGANIEAHDKTVTVNGDRPDWTPLAAAIWAQRPDAVEALLKRGVNPNQRDTTGNVPLHWAVSILRVQLTDQNYKMVESLLTHGADPNVRNNSGYTPLDTLKMRLGGKSGCG
jgi:ankyrin repeat protein